MVRLKDSDTDPRTQAVPKFQFHNGSIKRWISRLRGEGELEFQFHNGSIKSPLMKSLRSGSILSFNSTMVSIKSRDDNCAAACTNWFQFHNGSIKSPRNDDRDELEQRFQFHNGSIKSVGDVYSRLKLLVFQFHNGSIKSLHRLNATILQNAVSIPQWFD